MSKHTPIKSNFIYPTIRHTDFKFGSLGSEILRSDGDWRDYLPPDELQNKRGIESSSCYIQAQQHAIATIIEEKYQIKDEDYSARFNAFLSNGTPYGGSPIEGADSFRHDGLIPEPFMPFSDEIKSWTDYHSWKDANEALCRKLGQKYLGEYTMNYQIVFERGEDVQEKYRKLRLALQRSPVPFSVYGWLQDDQGNYTKTDETQDNHLTLCVYLDDDNCPYILDTYSPFIKKLTPFYNSNFAMEWTVNQIATAPITSKLSLWERIIGYFKALQTCKVS